MISAMRAARRAGVGGEAAGAVLLGEAEDEGGGAAGLGDGVEGLDDGGGGHVGEALLADPVARQRHRGADQPLAAGAEEAGLLEAVEAGAHGGAGGGGVEADGGDHADRRRCRARGSCVLVLGDGGAGGADVGAAFAAGAEHGSVGGPTQASVKSRMVRWMREETRQTRERRRFSGSKRRVSGRRAASSAMSRPLKRVTGRAVAGRRKFSFPAGVRLARMTSSPPCGRGGLLVGRGHLVVAVVEVGGQEGEDVVDPVLVVGAAVLDAAGPAAAHGAEAHRACSRRRGRRCPRRRPGSWGGRGRGSGAGASAATSRCRRGF